MWFFWHITWLCTNQQTESLTFSFFLFERYGRYKYANHTKTLITCVKKRKRKKSGFPFVCTCGSNTTLKVQIETLQIERGIAEMPFFQFFVVITWLILRSIWHRVLAISLGKWANKLVSMFSLLCLQHCLHQISHWSGTMIFIRI